MCVISIEKIVSELAIPLFGSLFLELFVLLLDLAHIPVDLLHVLVELLDLLSFLCLVEDQLKTIVE